MPGNGTQYHSAYSIITLLTTPFRDLAAKVETEGVFELTLRNESSDESTEDYEVRVQLCHI